MVGFYATGWNLGGHITQAYLGTRGAGWGDMIGRLVIVCGWALACLAVLPPGYEEELFCPPEMCLKQRRHVMGWSGPRAAAHECCDPFTGQTSPPHAWGYRVDAEIRRGLLAHDWHSNQCQIQTGECRRGDFMPLKGRPDSARGSCVIS